jgi:hypothetical protein
MRAASRILAGLLALAAVVGGVLLIVEVAVAALERSPWLVAWDRWWRSAQEEEWSSGDVRTVALVLVLVGLVLLVVALSRWRPTRLPLREEPGVVGGDLRRASLEGALGRTVEDLDGVEHARVRVVGGRARVRVDSSRREPGDLGGQVERRVAERLAALQLDDPPKVAVNVRPRED